VIGDDEVLVKISFAQPVAGTPCGALNENRRGSISEMVKPEIGQANFSENTMRPSGALSPSTADFGVCGSTGSAGST
jgi:hypothetical protein